MVFFDGFFIVFSMVRVLVGCPTASVKSYCLEQFLIGLKSLSFPDFDVCLVDNSSDSTYFELLKSKADLFEKETGKKFEVLRDGMHIEKPRQRLVFCRNILRKKVLEENYDYFFSLEQDVIAPANSIEKLLSCNQKIASCTYLNLMPTQKVGVVAYRFDSEENKKQGLLTPLGLNDVLPSRFFEVAASGLGVLLIHRSVLEKISFRVEDNSIAFDDIFFAKDARENGFKIFLDSSLFCLHLFRSSFSSKDL